MFAKLLKYEWNATAGLLGILSAAAAGAGLLGGVCLRVIFTAGKSVVETDANSVILLPVTLLLVFLMLGLFAYVFAVQIIVYIRFYRSRFTDEGYLTFTLPVRTVDNFLAALSNIVIWQVISSLVMFVTVFLMILIGVSGVPGIQVNLLDTQQISQAFRGFFTQDGFATYRLMNMVLGIVSFFCAPVLIMSCITMGAVLAKKHKILAAIGLYYGVSMAVSMLTSAGSVIMLANLESMEPDPSVLALSVVIQLVIQLGLTVGGSCLSIWLMEKKLNLP